MAVTAQTTTHPGLQSTKSGVFPWRDMKLSLPLLVLFALLMVGWWHIAASSPSWLAALQSHKPAITAVVTGGFFLALLGVSARSYVPGLLVLGGALVSGFTGDSLSLFGPGVVLSGVLALASFVGPLPGLGGKLWRRGA